jgi:RIO-like serine/threonine protein kinase
MIAPGSATILKHDAVGRISLVDDGRTRFIRREPAYAMFGARWVSRLLAGNEARALRRLERVEHLPRLLAWDGRVLDRSFIGGEPMQVAGVRDPAYFPAARRMLQALHRHGVVHNDLAKEANWLVTEDGRPALIDFQLAWTSNRRSRLFRLLAREDLRHLLKHKRTYFREQLTPVERRLLKRPSWLRSIWFRTGKRLYRFITRRLLNWRDNEGRGAVPEQPASAQPARDQSKSR